MTRRHSVSVLVGVVVAAGVIATVAVRNTAAGEATDSCCFTNPRYTGVCQVTPAEGESCGSILAYLNNPSSSGKGYCGGTATRGGWQQASCE